MSNYKAIIAKVDRVVPIPSADKIHTAFVLGEQVVVSKSVDVGHVGVLFLAGTQLSEDYTKHSNLHRDSTKNLDTTKSGFFENSRRVRAQPFLKVRSEGYFADIESLSFTGFDISTLKVGDSFEELNGVKVCNKYLNEKSLKAIGNNNTKARKKDTTPLFAEHGETSQFKQNINKIVTGDLISIQAKVHGTSCRMAYTKVMVDLPKWKQLVNKIIPMFPDFKYDYVVGTRRVVLQDSGKEGFHGSEGFRFEVMEAVKPYLTKGMTLYGEIAGYANGKPIMSTHSTSMLKDKKVSKQYGDTIVYKYGCVEGAYRFHIYRITMTNDEGFVTEFTQPQLVKWCNDRGILPAMDVVEPFVFNGDYDNLSTLVEFLTERPEVGGADFIDPSHLSEGVIIRVDNQELSPLFLKSKNFYFKCLEGIAQEKEVDLEDIS